MLVLPLKKKSVYVNTDELTSLRRLSLFLAAARSFLAHFLNNARAPAAVPNDRGLAVEPQQ